MRILLDARTGVSLQPNKSRVGKSVLLFIGLDVAVVVVVHC